MNCMNMEEKITAFVDGTIPSEDEQLLHEHLRDCQGCKHILEEHQKIFHALQTMGEEDLTSPVDFSVSVIAELEEQGAFTAERKATPAKREKPMAKGFWSFGKTWMGGGALAAAGLMLIFMGFTGGEIPMIPVDDGMESAEMSGDMDAVTDDVLIQEVPEAERAQDEIDHDDSQTAEGETVPEGEDESDYGAMESPAEEETPREQERRPNYPMILGGVFGILTGGVWIYLRLR